MSHPCAVAQPFQYRSAAVVVRAGLPQYNRGMNSARKARCFAPCKWKGADKDGTTTKEDVRIDKDDADELNREAAEDLERIENEVKREAEQYVEAVDGDGNEKESVEAAATAFDFDRAEAETEELLIKTTGEADEA